MATRLNGFDRIAWLYDPLAHLVFGNRLINAQVYYLHRIKPDSKVLILGGGTGKILEALVELHLRCHVTYIDASMAMLKRAQQRNVRVTIQYIHGDEGFIPESTYDTVITPFYLDMFTEPDLAAAIRQIASHTAPGALWIASDFYPTERWWAKVLLSIMYAFFRATTGIQAKSLPDWKGALEQNGWAQSECQSDGFIGSAVFHRSDSQ